MATKLDEIEKELKEISPWPWKSKELEVGEFELRMGNARSKKSTYLSHNVISYEPSCYPEDGDGSQYKQAVGNLLFITAAPERIAALVRYVRAAEIVLIKPMIKTNMDELAQAHKDFNAARRELGLE